MQQTKQSPLIAICSFIVDKRNLFFLIFALLAIFSAFAKNWVHVENSLSYYLPDTTETKKGIDLMAEEFVPKSEKKNPFLKVLSHIYLILVVMIGFVLFRAESLSEFGSMMKAMFTFGLAGSSSDMLFAKLLNPLNIAALLAGVVFSMPVGDKLKKFKFSGALSYIAALGAVVIALLCLSSGSYNPFIYFRF